MKKEDVKKMIETLEEANKNKKLPLKYRLTFPFLRFIKKHLDTFTDEEFEKEMQDINDKEVIDYIKQLEKKKEGELK